MGNITVTGESVISIPAHTINNIAAHTINDIQGHTINNIEGHTIDRIKAIAPVATHIKEVNHIDPISIESLHVRGVRNVDPIQIERLNVTNFPAMNMSLRQLPPMDMSVRKMPPLSVGLHQHLDIPSDYTLRASLLGLECVRVRIQGKSTVAPRESYRREVSRTLNRSYPEVAAGGNPAIPSHRTEKCVTVEHCSHPPTCRGRHAPHGAPPESTHGGPHMGHGGYTPHPGGFHASASLRCGPPMAAFRVRGDHGHDPNGASTTTARGG